jgi:hypothetical protein
MNFFESQSTNKYLQQTAGTYGIFRTRAGRVDFLETKARLSNTPDHSQEARLTQYLRPVREALPVSEMNFNQLLQRDLDDHRVAIELVPYLLSPRGDGPVFFPPVVACLLPFSNRQPKESFPAPSDPVFSATDGLWRTIEYGDAFRFDQLYESESKEHTVKLGRLNWNPESAELVVIDGQHRAMALLAIDRTINNRWTGPAAKYAAFYKPVVDRLIGSMSEDERSEIFKAVELPVNIIWFPELPQSGSHHKAARKIFVDLNKNARPPSQSRLMLLSDGDLYSIFTRELLNQMRSSGAGYPIYGVEYDNPSRDQSASAKWSTLTNITAIFESVRRLTAGPEKFFREMDSVFVGRDNETNMRITLGRSLDLQNALPETIPDERVFSREDIDSSDFPPSQVSVFAKQFTQGWGIVLSKLYSTALPFKIHAEALKILQDSWIPSGIPASALAKESIFEGSGLFWTIRDSEAHWREENQRRTSEGREPLLANDVIEAWGVIQAKKLEFVKSRAKLYLTSELKEKDSEAAFSIFSTAAAQIGFVFAARAIAAQLNVGFHEIEKFSTTFISAINAAMDKRRLFMARGTSRSINFLPRLDTTFAIYFRYFWLELLNSPESKKEFSDAGYQFNFDQIVKVGHSQYREFLIRQDAKKLRELDDTLVEADAIAKATIDVDKRLGKAVQSVFGITLNEYELRSSAPIECASQNDQLTHQVEQELLEDSTGNGLSAGDVDEIEKLLKGDASTVAGE